MAPETIIDTKMHGQDAITASYLLVGDGATLVETGPKSTVANVLAGLEKAGVDSLRWIVVTHIHLDHAGAAGTLANRFPEAKIAVHSLGAPHLVDPSKLWKSASRIYGDRMEEMWGGIDAIDAERIHVLEDGDTLDLGGDELIAYATPGHAYHHHAYLDPDTGTMFVGDALGVRLPDVGKIRAATPPPELDLEKATASIELVRRVEPARVLFTHYGPHDEGVHRKSVDDICDEAIETLGLWADWVQKARMESHDLDRVTELVEEQARASMESDLEPDQIARMEDTTSYRMNASGYMRYFDKRES
jgi:glyoxylase-like metal-dependent hydrolase (beta-lactamase superfamily II)